MNILLSEVEKIKRNCEKSFPRKTRLFSKERLKNFKLLPEKIEQQTAKSKEQLDFLTLEVLLISVKY